MRRKILAKRKIANGKARYCFYLNIASGEIMSLLSFSMFLGYHGLIERNGDDDELFLWAD